MIIDSGVITGSLVVSGSYNQTGSAVIDGNLTVLGTLNATISGSATSASYALSASYATTASVAPGYLPLTGGTINGNLTVRGTGSFDVLITTYESSSVIYSSGSTKFGDSLDDTHQFTGSVSVTGSLSAPNLNWDGSTLTLSGPSGNIVVPYTGKLQSALDPGNNITVSDGSGSMILRAGGVDRVKIRHTPTSSIDLLSPVIAPQGVTASLFGTSSQAISASYALVSTIALTSSYVLNAVSASRAVTAASATSASYALSASYAPGSDTSISASYAETASYVLNAVSASYALNAPYYLLTSSFNTFSGSISTRLTDVESTASILTSASASLVVASGSTSVRLTNLESTASALIIASASFATVSASFSSTSGSLSTRTTNLESTASTLTSASASFASSINSLDSVTGSYATTGSNQFKNSQVITGSLIVTAGVSGSFSGSFQGNGSGLTNVPASGIVGLQLNQIGSGSVTASIAPDLGFRVNTNSQITGSLIVSNGISGNLNGEVTGSFSGSLYNLQNTTLGHIPFFSQSQILVDSAILQVDNGLDQGYSIAINQNGVDTTNPEALFVYQASTSSFNVVSGKGNLNNYLQLNIQNLNNGANASSDVVATANNGNESTNFIDMGINGANFTGPIGNANDAYLYSTGENLHIGNASSGGQHLGFFVGGDDVAANNKLQLNPGNLHELTGSLNASAGFTGSLQGNAATATSASYAATASYGADFTASNALINNTLTAQTLIVQTITSSIQYSSGSNIFGNLLTNTQQFTGSVTVTGSLAVNGSSVILTNQTSSMSVLSSSYALSASYAPGSDTAVSASYALSASYAETAPAYVTTASYNQDSASFSTRTTNLEATASTLTTASASFALVSASYSAASGSISVRVTDLESTSSALVSASGSFSTRTTNLEATASILTNASASFANNINSILGNYATTGSNVFVGNQIVSGSLFTTGSNTLIGITQLTGALNITGSTVQVGNNTLLGNTNLSGSLIISGTLGGAPSIKIYGDTEHSGYIRFDPTTTNIDNSISASYIYVSGSTQDLYFSQNGKGYTNATRLRWIEGNLYTGLLNGGLITTSSSTVYQITSGSGIIVNLNASLSDNPYPTIQYVNWPNLSASIAPLTASYQQAFVGVQSNGTIFAQGTPFANGQFDTLINIGTVLFQNGSTINGVKTQPTVAYGFEQRQSIFTRAFGPLKLSGLTLAPSGSSTGSLVVGSGTAYADGANYVADPNDPSYVVDGGTNVSKIFRYYDSGSTFVYDTNAGAGYGAIDPTKYSNNGTLTTVSPGDWSIQRVFWFPNSVAKAIVVYYGNASYATEAEAIANINIENFVEAPNTAANAIYLGAIVISGNGVFTTPADYKIVPGGLFRAVGGSGGGGSVVTQTLTGLSDVAITGPTNLQPFAYSSTAGKWINASIISASIVGTATSATSASYAATSSWALNAINANTASYVEVAQTASYVLNAISASYSNTASYVEVAQTASYVALAQTASYVTLAQTASYVQNAQTASYIQNAQTASYVLNAVTASYVQNAQTASYILNAVSASYASTASFVVNAQTASYVQNAQTASYVLLAQTASYVLNAQTASYVLNAVSASRATSALNADTASFVALAQTASYVLNAVSASYALTASAANIFTANQITASNILVNGTVTAQTLNVQQVTSSIVYSSGSNKFGSLLTDAQQLTGSVTITGSLQVNGRTPLYIDQTGSLTVTSASYAATASYANSTATIPFNVGATSTYYGVVNSSVVGSNNVFTLDTGSYTAAKFLYTITNGSNARTGEILAVWNDVTATAQFTDSSTTDIGITSDVTASVSVVSSQVQLNFQTNSSFWKIKSQGTLI